MSGAVAAIGVTLILAVTGYAAWVKYLRNKG